MESPTTKRITHDITAHVSCDIGANVAIPFTSRAKATMENASDAIMMVMCPGRECAIDPPRITDKSGNAHGAKIVRTQAVNDSRARDMDDIRKESEERASSSSHDRGGYCMPIGLRKQRSVRVCFLYTIPGHRPIRPGIDSRVPGMPGKKPVLVLHGIFHDKDPHCSRKLTCSRLQPRRPIAIDHMPYVDFDWLKA